MALSYGKTKDDGNGLGSAADYETRGIALFHSINDNLTLVAELNQFEIEGRDTAALDEETRTFAVGAALSLPNTGRGWQPNRRSRHPLRCSGAYVERPHALNTVRSAVPQRPAPSRTGLLPSAPPASVPHARQRLRCFVAMLPRQAFSGTQVAFSCHMPCPRMGSSDSGCAGACVTEHQGEVIRTAMSDARLAETVAQDLARQLMHPHLGFVLFFCSAEYDLPALGDALRQYFGGVRPRAAPRLARSRPRVTGAAA